MVPRRSVVPGSVTSAAPLTSKVTSAQIYQGEQITLRQFVPIAQGGIFAKFSGNQRVVVVPADPNQMLGGAGQGGDHGDLYAVAKYHGGDLERATSRVDLPNPLVLRPSHTS